MSDMRRSGEVLAPVGVSSLTGFDFLDGVEEACFGAKASHALFAVVLAAAWDRPAAKQASYVAPAAHVRGSACWLLNVEGSGSGSGSWRDVQAGSRDWSRLKRPAVMGSVRCLPGLKGSRAPGAYSHVSSSKVQFGLSSSGKRKSLMTDVARLNLGLARRMDSIWSRNRTKDGKLSGRRRSTSGS